MRMAKNSNAVAEYKDIFVKLHRYQHHGAENLIMLLTRYVRAKAEYMASYIELVAERAGVSSTGRITTTNKDIMTHVVKAMVEIDKGLTPSDKELDAAWALFIYDYRNHNIEL
jgi:hypothetical protein